MIRETSSILLDCLSADGQHDEFVFPKLVIDSSVTGGQREVLGFRARLEIARRTMDRNPDFKAAFAVPFRRTAFEVACCFVVSSVLESLLYGLEAAGAVPIETIRAACEKYPYLKVSPTRSLGTFKTELVDEAISGEVMASELMKKIGPGLELLCSPDYAATWGTSHIIAWTLNDFADRRDLQEEASGLSSGEADKLIWNRAWGGAEFSGRFAQAVHYLAWEIARFVIEAIDLPRRSVAELEAILGLRSSGYYLEIASRAKRSSHPVLKWVTRTYAGLQSFQALAVADTLRDARWQAYSDESRRRQFIHAEAKKRTMDFESVILNGIGLPGFPTYSPEIWSRCGHQAFLAGSDFITAVDEPDFSQIGIDHDISAQIDATLLLRKAIGSSKLSLDAQRVMYARIQDHAREEAHIPLGLSRNQVAAAWKELNRKKNIFVKILSPSPRANSTL
jgi:hypothetical protein